MLHDWAIVLLSLVSGAVGGSISTLLRIRFDRKEAAEQRQHDRERQEARLAHERESEWRERRVFAAADFSTGVEQAILGVREIISAVGDKRDIEPVVAEAKRLTHECVARVARIKLLFGEDAAPTQPAKDVLSELELARGAAVKTDPTFAWSKLEKVYKLHAEFNAAALEALGRAP